jgi:hypothetical protein
MDFRLGWLECPSCGYEISAEQLAEDAEHSGAQRHATKLPLPPQPPPSTGYPRLGLKAPPEDTLPGSLGQEKALLLAVFFAWQVVSTFIVASQYTGAGNAFLNIPSLLISALFATLCIGFVLYYDNDCLRQCCMWVVGINVLIAVFTVGMAVYTGQVLASLPLIPTVAIFGWLVSILARDSRSE